MLAFACLLACTACLLARLARRLHNANFQFLSFFFCSFFLLSCVLFISLPCDVLEIHCLPHIAAYYFQNGD